LNAKAENRNQKSEIRTCIYLPAGLPLVRSCTAKAGRPFATPIRSGGSDQKEENPKSKIRRGRIKVSG
jgi:hypothetical protein